MDRPLLLEVNDLKTRFHTAEGTIYARDGSSYVLHEGETLAVVGESGVANLSSVLSIMGLIRIPPGQIAQWKRNLPEPDLLKMAERRWKRCGAKRLQWSSRPDDILKPGADHRQADNRVAEKHMAMGHDVAVRRTVELLEWVGLPDPARRLGDILTNSRRDAPAVMIAMGLGLRRLSLSPDEPTTALDVTIQAQIVELVIRLRQEVGMAMIWITHDLGVVAGLADRVIVMYAGFIVEEADVDSLYEDPPPSLHFGPAGSPAPCRPPASSAPEVDPRRTAQPVSGATRLPLCPALRARH